MKRLLIALVFLLATALPAAAGNAVVTYTDRLNRTVKIPVPVRRAVFLQMYELLPALNAWDRVAGVAGYAYRNEVIRAARPDIERFPSVGNGWDINIEALLQLKPDLVITWAAKPETVRFLEEKGLTVIAIYPESIQELYSVMALLGTLFERQERMATVKSEMERVFALVRERRPRAGQDKQPSMLYLGGQPNSVSGGSGINNDLITLVGGTNPAAALRERSTLVSLEKIVIWNPDIVFIWGNAGYTARDIITNPQWGHVKAIKRERVYKLPEWTTWGPRLPLVGLWMAKQAFPERYRDVDFATVADRLYRAVFRIPYSRSRDTP